MAFARGMKATRAAARQYLGTVGTSAEGAGGLPCATSRHLSIDVEERESTDIANAIATGAADIGLVAEHALPDSIERIPFSEDRLVIVVARHDELARPAADRFSRGGRTATSSA